MLKLIQVWKKCSSYDKAFPNKHYNTRSLVSLFVSIVLCRDWPEQSSLWVVTALHTSLCCSVLLPLVLGEKQVYDKKVYI